MDREEVASNAATDCFGSLSGESEGVATVASADCLDSVDREGVATDAGADCFDSLGVEGTATVGGDERLAELESEEDIAARRLVFMWKTVVGSLGERFGAIFLSTLSVYMLNIWFGLDGRRI